MNRSVFDIPGFDWRERRNFQNAFTDQPAFLIGFAKSLNDLDLRKLSGHWTCGINWVIRKFPPSFSFSLDPHPIAAEYDKLFAARDHTLVVTRNMDRYFPPTLPHILFECKKLHPEGPVSVHPPRVTSELYGTSTSASYAALWLLACGFDPIIMIGVDFSIPKADIEPGGALTPNEKYQRWVEAFKKIDYGHLQFRDFCSPTAETHAEAVPAQAPRVGFNAEVEDRFFSRLLKQVVHPAGKMIVNASAYKNPEFKSVPWVEYDWVIEKLASEGHLR